MKATFRFRSLSLVVIGTFLFPAPGFAAQIALKNFREIFESLSVASGVKPTAQMIQAFNAVRDSLPKNGDPEEYSAPMNMAVTRLAGHFCQAFVLADAAKADPKLRRSHKKIQFNKGPKDLTAEAKREVITDYARFYWQRDPEASEMETILALIDDLSTSVQLPATDAVRQVLALTCTSMASSLDFLAI